MNQMKKTMMLGICIVIALLFLSGPVAAADAISTIHAGNTVFIGEQGLDITAAMDGDTILGWWASGAAISSTSPDYTVTVPNPASFSVYPADFATRTGNWYRMSSLTSVNGTAFSVADPHIELRVDDTTVNVDVTNKWIPTDDELGFRIDTNLVQMIQRTGVGSAPVTIKVQDPSGAILTSLINKAGTTTNLVNYPLTSTPQNTGAIWDTSRRSTYAPGTYYIWVECNVNSMKDNYGSEGKAVSSKVSLLNQDQNPLMGNKGYTTNPTTAITTSATKAATPVVTTTTPTATTPAIEVTTTATPIATTPIETVSTTSTIVPPVTSATRTTHTPGFGAVWVILSLTAALGLLLSRK